MTLPYDIGTKILYETCFSHDSKQKALPEELSLRILTKCCVDSESDVKTHLNLENVHATLDSQVMFDTLRFASRCYHEAI